MQACRHQRDACLAAAPIFVRLVSGTFPGWTCVVLLLSLLTRVLLVRLVAAGGFPPTAVWRRLRSRRGAQALGIGGSCLAILLGGGLGRTPMATITSTTVGLAVWDSSSLYRGKPEAHLFVDVLGQGRDEGLLQALPTSVAGIVVCNDYVVQVGEVFPPT